MKVFEALISPLSAQEFFNSYWTKHELHLTSGFNAQSLFSIEKLNMLLNTNQDHLSFPVLRLIKNGKVISESRYTELITKRRQTTERQISLGKVIEFCKGGATLTFNGLNNYSNELSDYCNKLSEELKEATQINCYLTQKGNQGFEPHFDHHEIFILQVQGEKEWELFGNAGSFPVPTNKHYEQGEPDYNNKRNYLLKTGDILYMPRGMWHQAKSTSSSSFHLTLNIMCDLKLDFLHWLLDNMASHNEKFRENLFQYSLSANENLLKFAKEYLQTKESDYFKLLIEFKNEKKKNKTKEIPFTV